MCCALCCILYAVCCAPLCVMVAVPQQHESECGVRIIETILELAVVGATLVADMPRTRAGHSRIRLAAMIAGVVPFSGFMFHGE